MRAMEGKRDGVVKVGLSIILGMQGEWPVTDKCFGL